MKKQSCMFCGVPATLLCDGVIGYDAEEDENGIMISLPRKIHTCDAPMCRDCAEWQGNIFFSGPTGFMDTRDLCPICHRLLQLGRNIRNHRIEKIVREPCMTDEQASIIRKAHWASYNNKYRNGLKVEQGGGQQCLDF